MKAQTLFVLASTLGGVLAAPLREREAAPKVVTVYEQVVHVVTTTRTIWVKSTPKSARPPSAVLVPKPAPKPSPAPAPEPEEKTSDDLPEKQKPRNPTAVNPPQTPEPQPKTVLVAPPPNPVKTEEEQGNGSAPSNTALNTGDATFYNTGLGSCGIQNNDTEFVVAISHTLLEQYDKGDPNKNPLCNKKIKCMRGDKSVVVTVTDKCPTCQKDDLDLSPAAFNMLASPDEGRVKITWSWE